MTSLARFKRRPWHRLNGSDLLLMLVFLAALLACSSLLAGTDATFTAATTKITGWANGSLGKLAAVAGIGVALVGMVLKFDWRLIAGAAGIGLTAATGPGIVTALTTATF